MRRRRLFYLGGFFLLFSVGMALWFLCFDLPRLNAAHGREGRDATGRVISTRVTELDQSTTYKATFRFIDEGGGTHTVENTYPKPYWDTLQAGSEVHVRYIANEPTYAFDTESYFGKKNLSTLLVICSWVFAFGVVILFLGRFASR